MKNIKQQAKLWLTFGIVSLASCFFLTKMNITFPISGIILGSFAIKEMSNGEIDENAKKWANAGIICSIISLILMPIIYFIFILISLALE